MIIDNNLLSNISKDYLDQDITYIFLKNRVPVHTSIMLTNKCNFQCLHCYMKPLREERENLSINQWREILKQVKSHGSISLTITGGEPLLSPLFIDVYNFAYDNNFKITIMSNLSLITDKILALFKNKPPHKILGTIYGASDITYENFCHYYGGWGKIKNNISKLLEIKSNIELRTVLNKQNIEELSKMNKFAKDNKLKFHAYRHLDCDINGDINLKKYQINKQEIINSFNIMDDNNQFRHATEINKTIWKNGYKNCGAGLVACYINYNGEMHLCNQCTTPAFSLIKNNFAYCWQEISKIRKKAIEQETECSYCKYNIFCGKCAPIFNKEKEKNGFPFIECNNQIYEDNEW